MFNFSQFKLQGTRTENEYDDNNQLTTYDNTISTTL